MLPPCFSFFHLSCFLPILSPSLSPYLSPLSVSFLCLLSLSPPLCLPSLSSLLNLSAFCLIYIPLLDLFVCPPVCLPFLCPLSVSPLCLPSLSFFLSRPVSQLSVAPHLASVSPSSIGFRLRVRYFCPPDSIATTYLQFLSYSSLSQI
jgi:hypothetical protein